VDIYDVFERDQWAVRAILDALAAAPERSLAERRSLVAMLREALLQNGRASNPVYGALLRRGADPAPILAAIEAHTVACQSAIEIDRDRLATPGWLVSIALLNLLLDDYFEEQRLIYALARKHLPRAQARRRERRPARADARGKLSRTGRRRSMTLFRAPRRSYKPLQDLHGSTRARRPQLAWRGTRLA